MYQVRFIQRKAIALLSIATGFTARMITRREFSLAMGVAAVAVTSAAACSSTPPAAPPTKQVDAGLLNVGYAEAGPAKKKGKDHMTNHPKTQVGVSFRSVPDGRVRELPADRVRRAPAAELGMALSADIGGDTRAEEPRLTVSARW
jgi:hypothetical protein